VVHDTLLYIGYVILAIKNYNSCSSLKLDSIKFMLQFVYIIVILLGTTKFSTRKGINPDYTKKVLKQAGIMYDIKSHLKSENYF